MESESLGIHVLELIDRQVSLRIDLFGPPIEAASHRPVELKCISRARQGEGVIQNVIFIKAISMSLINASEQSYCLIIILFS